MDQATYRRWLAVYQAAANEPTNGSEIWHPRYAAGWQAGYDAGTNATAHGITEPGYRALAEAYNAGHAAGLDAGYKRRDAEVTARANEAAALALGRLRPRPIRFRPAKPVRTVAECLATWHAPAHTTRTAA